MFSQSTPNFGLPQYQANDTLNVLVDFNGAMSNIDTAMQDNKLAAEGAQNTANTANGKADTNAFNISALDSQVNDPATGLAHEVTQIGGNVDTVNALIGNGTPTTTDQTIIGAINELNSGKVNESDVEGKYAITTHHATVSSASDGTKTFGTQISEIVTALKAVIDDLADDEFLRVTGGFFHAAFPYPMYSPDYRKNDSVNTQMQTIVVNNVPNSADFFTIYINAGSPSFTSGTFGGTQSDTWENELTNVATSTSRLYYDIYKQI